MEENVSAKVSINHTYNTLLAAAGHEKKSQSFTDKSAQAVVNSLRIDLYCTATAFKQRLNSLKKHISTLQAAKQQAACHVQQPGIAAQNAQFDKDTGAWVPSANATWVGAPVTPADRSAQPQPELSASTTTPSVRCHFHQSPTSHGMRTPINVTLPSTTEVSELRGTNSALKGHITRLNNDIAQLQARYCQLEALLMDCKAQQESEQRQWDDVRACLEADKKSAKTEAITLRAETSNTIADLMKENSALKKHNKVTITKCLTQSTLPMDGSSVMC